MMRLLLVLILLAFIPPAHAGFVRKDYRYEGGVALDIAALPRTGGRKAYWAEVERQSSACIAAKKGNVIPCSLLWADALQDDATKYSMGLAGLPDFRKPKTSDEILPQHFYDDVLPAILDHVQTAFYASNAYLDSSGTITAVLVRAARLCDTAARCLKYETKLQSVLQTMPPEATTYHLDSLELRQLLVALQSWRAPDAALAASLSYLRSPYAGRCDLCVETLAGDFTKRGRGGRAAASALSRRHARDAAQGGLVAGAAGAGGKSAGGRAAVSARQPCADFRAVARSAGGAI
jgi:hypothetical protein